jgi:hypothetical protein
MSTSLATRRDRLFELLQAALDAGATTARVGEVDDLVGRARAALFLKHDVHGLPLDALASFARQEADRGITGTYFFMVPDHPLTARHYGFDEQVDAMGRLASMGHELGLHVDPFFLLHHLGQPLRPLLVDVLASFRDAGLELRCGNMHGNSRFKMPDRNGYGTSFDLFEELGRQPDFPELRDVPDPIAALIRRQRTSIRALGFTHWADMPLWSARHGFVVTNFVTDNFLAKLGTIEVLVHPDPVGSYKLVDRQPPGSRTPAEPRCLVPCPPSADSGALPTGSRDVGFETKELREWFVRLAGRPTLVLIHPEHYCVEPERRGPCR